MFGHRKFPRLSQESGPVPLALEASALTTELPRYLKYMFLYVFVMGYMYVFCWQGNTKLSDVNVAFHAQSDTWQVTPVKQ